MDVVSAPPVPIFILCCDRSGSSLLGLESQSQKVIYKIIITGNNGGIWTIDLTDHECPIKTIDEQADCTLTFFPEDAINIVHGTLNPIELWMQGKLQVSGDRTLAEIFLWFLVGRLQWRKPSAAWWLE